MGFFVNIQNFLQNTFIGFEIPQPNFVARACDEPVAVITHFHKQNSLGVNSVEQKVQLEFFLFEIVLAFFQLRGIQGHNIQVSCKKDHEFYLN